MACSMSLEEIPLKTEVEWPEEASAAVKCELEVEPEQLQEQDIVYSMQAALKSKSERECKLEPTDKTQDTGVPHMSNHLCSEVGKKNTSIMPRKGTDKERMEKPRLAKCTKYAEIKQDPILYAFEKEKQRKNREKIKTTNKSIHEETPREQRERRKRWREASRKYRERNKQLKNNIAPQVVVLGTPSDLHPNKAGDPLLMLKSPASQIRRVRYVELKKRKSLLNVIDQLQKENRKLRREVRELRKEKRMRQKM